jgi:hypothetical protein
MATARNNTVPFFVTPCILVGYRQGLGEACCFHFHCRTMQMETFLSTHHMTRCHTPEDGNLQCRVTVVHIIRATYSTQHHVPNLLARKYKLRSACARARKTCHAQLRSSVRLMILL